MDRHFFISKIATLPALQAMHSLHLEESFSECFDFLPMTVQTKGYATEAEMVSKHTRSGSTEKLDIAVVFQRLSKDSGILDDVVYHIRPTTTGDGIASDWFTRKFLRPFVWGPVTNPVPREFYALFGNPTICMDHALCCCCLLITFIERYSPLSSRLTAFAYDST